MRDCSNCKHVLTNKRPKIMEETGFGDGLMFDDVDEVVYICKHSESPSKDQETLSPVVGCALWQTPSGLTDEKRRELDALMARAAARHKD